MTDEASVAATISAYKCKIHSDAYHFKKRPIFNFQNEKLLNQSFYGERAKGKKKYFDMFVSDCAVPHPPASLFPNLQKKKWKNCRERRPI